MGLSTMAVLLLVWSVESRGPHHPRGTTISKHHTHYRPTRDPQAKIEKLTHDAKLLHDTQHIQEDLGEWAESKDLSSMTDEELEFHYFQLHDFDNNSRLDGLEILQAIHHTEDHYENEEHELEEKTDFEYYVEMIDKVFEEDDTNADGYLSYPEYVAGRKKDKMNNLDGVARIHSAQS